ncbi:unnamed protein product [Peronospora effusa]|nr:unnamed protein product [Peronospora effusa]
MATPTLQRDQTVLHISPLSMSSSGNPLMQQQWKSPIAKNHVHADHGSTFQSSVAAPPSAIPLSVGPLSAIPLSVGPVLPRITSLLNGVQPRNLQSLDEKKRKHLAMKREDSTLDETVHEGSRIQRPSSAAKEDWNHHLPLPVASSINMPSSPLDARSQMCPTPIETSSRYTAQVPLDFPSYKLSHDPAERRRLFCHHSIDPLEIHIPTETPMVLSIYDQRLPRKYKNNGRFHHHLSPSHTHAGFSSRPEAVEIDTIVQKRRRVVAPTSTPSLYEPEYGLTVFETSKSLMDSRDIPRIEHLIEGSVSAPRQHYIRSNLSDMEKYVSPVTVNSRIIYSESEGILGTTAFATKTKTPRRACYKHTNVDNRDSIPVTTLVIQSKELRKSNSLVRNRHDEVDWVATFLNVGFESSSIYALMCPLRKGRWKPEEESYTMGLLRLIENGTILLRHGQSIRGYIGEKLHSDDMRVLKKLSNCKMFHFVKLINPRLAEEEKVDMSVVGAPEGLERLEQLKGDFLRSVQLEALVAVRKHLNDSSLRYLVNTRA